MIDTHVEVSGSAFGDSAIADAKPVQRTPGGRYQQKREVILDAAARRFNTQGVRGATLEDIARGVGMNLTSIRHYFRRKDDLVAVGYLRSIAVHAEHLGEAVHAGNREARVRRLVKQYFARRSAIREGRGPEVMIFGDMRSLTDEYAAQVWPRYVELFGIVRRVVADERESAVDRQRVGAQACLLCWQLFRSVLWLPCYPVDQFDWVEAKFTDILFNGLFP